VVSWLPGWWWLGNCQLSDENWQLATADADTETGSKIHTAFAWEDVSCAPAHYK